MKNPIFVLILFWISISSLPLGVLGENAVEFSSRESIQLEENDGTWYAFIAAVSDYDEAVDLSCALQDAHDLKSRFLQMGFEERNITFLVSESDASHLPTRKKILSRYANFLSRLKQGDHAVVYLCGHGIQIPGKKGSWFCPMDAESEALDETTISIDEMLAELGESKADFCWMIVDACRNNQSAGTSGIFKDRAFGVKSLGELPEPPENVILMQSCQPGSISYESPNLANGIFTYCLLEALSMKSDADEDGEVSFTEIQKYVTEQTASLADYYVGKIQFPQVSGKITDLVLLRDLNYPKAETLIEEARKKAGNEEFTAALELAKEACVLCPRNRKFRVLKEKYESRLAVREHKTVFPDGDKTLQEICDGMPDGGTVTILKGKHFIPETVVTRGKITFRGEGGNPEYVILRGGTKNVLRIEDGFAELKDLTIQNEGDCFDLSPEELEKETEEEEKQRNHQENLFSAIWIKSPMAVLENCVFISEKACGAVISQKDSAPVFIRCLVKNCGGNGILVESGAKGVFRECRVTGSRWSGFVVCGTGTAPVVEKCCVEKGKDGGFYVLEGAGGKFTDCESRENVGIGFILEDPGTDPLVENCRIIGNHDMGIFVAGGSSGRFINCQVLRNTELGLGVAHAKSSPFFQNCRFKDGESMGIILYETKGTRFEMCESNGNLLGGIGVFGGAESSFNDCEIRGNDRDGLVVGEEGTKPVFENCRFLGNQGGIYLQKGAGGEFINCEAERNREFGIYLTGSGTAPKIEKSRFVNTVEGCGVLIQNEAGGIFTDCEISGNAGAGIQVEDGTPVFRKNVLSENGLSYWERLDWRILGGEPLLEENVPDGLEELQLLKEKEEKERQRKEELRAREELKRAETAMGINTENINPGKDDWETRKRSSPQKIGNERPQNR